MGPVAPRFDRKAVEHERRRPAWAENTEVRKPVHRSVTVRAAWNGTVLAESEHTILVEGNQYFPAQDVKKELLEKSESSTHCPWKGDARYYSIIVDGKCHEDAAWYYPETYDAAKGIKDYVAFWKGTEVSGTNEGTLKIRPPAANASSA
jgi:uncharacterized protein (DUF427 family)